MLRKIKILVFIVEYVPYIILLVVVKRLRKHVHAHDFNACLEKWVIEKAFEDKRILTSRRTNTY
jgi:hypothetical protein